MDILTYLGKVKREGKVHTETTGVNNFGTKKQTVVCVFILETTNKDIFLVSSTLSRLSTKVQLFSFFLKPSRVTKQQGIIHTHLFVHYIKRLVKSSYIFNGDLTSVARCSKDHVNLIKLL